ncbi:MAG: hypothetical protein JXB14_05700 [Candidatus Altiarchaeota archaeon]|nr:hypothetical protein [Candidatus Altiarchaeota archaeon]
MGFISVVWLRKGLRSISDNLIRRMFTYLVLLTFVCFIYATWKFILLQNMSSEALIITFTDAIIITSLFALISGAALCAKQIGELYGFKVGEVRK